MLSIWLGYGLIYGSISDEFWPTFRFTDGLLIGLSIGLVVGLFDGLRFELGEKGVAALPHPTFWQSTVNVLAVGSVIGLVAGLSYELNTGRNSGLIASLYVGSLSGLLCGLFFGIRGSRHSLANDIETVEALTWSWRQSLKRIPIGLLCGLLIGLILVLVGWDPSKGALNGILAGLVRTLPLMPFIVVIAATYGGIRGSILETRTIPNQGIRLSRRNAIRTGLSFGLTFVLLIGLFMAPGWNVMIGGERIWIGVRPEEGRAWVVGVADGLMFGLLTALWFGGLDILQHYILRLILWFTGHTPRNYARFLDYATERIFMQKVGGGYIFIHRLLMEYFAELDQSQSEMNPR